MQGIAEGGGRSYIVEAAAWTHSPRGAEAAAARTASAAAAKRRRGGGGRRGGTPRPILRRSPNEASASHRRHLLYHLKMGKMWGVTDVTF